MKLTRDVLALENICHIVAILPNQAEFDTLAVDISASEVSSTVLEYGDSHTTEIDFDTFNSVGKRIDTIAKETKNTQTENTRRNVLIFCNNGYQRSIPFLVYYLTTFHADEVPTIEKALSIILSQVDRENFANLLEPLTTSVRALLSQT